MTEKKMIHSVLKDGAVFDGDASKYIEWRLNLEMDLRSLGYGDHFFGAAPVQLHPMIDAALCHGIGKRLDAGTRESMAATASHDIMHNLDAQFLPGAKAVIEELMKAVRDLIVVGRDIRTYLATLRKLWTKYTARERFLQGTAKFPLKGPRWLRKWLRTFTTIPTCGLLSGLLPRLGMRADV